MSVQTQTPAARTDLAREAPVIVVGFDGSDESRRAVEMAAKRAGPGGTVIPVYATVAGSSWLGTPYYERVVEQSHHAAQQAVAAMEDLDTGHATVEPELLEGDPAEALLRIARNRDAREIVIGSRGLGRFRSLLGSTSHALLEQA